MSYDYNSLVSVEVDEFEKRRIPDKTLLNDFTVTNGDDVRRMERLLDMEEDSLAGHGPYYLKIDNCSCCGRIMNMYDFVFTALIDANHPKAFVAQVLAGDKKIIQSPRRVRCSLCGTLSIQKAQYFCRAYACDENA